jgi:hypothetical protein
MSNIGEDDQLEAATRHAEKVLDITGTELGTPAITGTELDPVSEALIDRAMPGRRPTGLCEHAYQGPRIMWITTAQPGVALCAPCQQRPENWQRLVEHAASTTTCDSCGEDATTFHELMVRVGPMIIAGHVCADCKARSESAS